MIDDVDTILASDDYAPPPPSPRSVAAHELANALPDALRKSDQISRAAGVNFAPRRSEDNRCWEFDWNAGPPAGRGMVRVYNPAYIAVSWTDATLLAPLPEYGRRTFASAEEALTFLFLAFVDGTPEEAMAVPVKRTKRDRG